MLDADVRDDPQACAGVLSAIMALPRLRRLRLQRVSFPDDVLARFWALNVPDADNAPRASMIEQLTGLMGAAAGGGGRRVCAPGEPRPA